MNLRLSILVAAAAISTLASTAAADPANMKPEDRAALEAELAQDAAQGRPKPAISDFEPGKAKVPANWQASVDGYLEGQLKDPYSAVKTVTRGPRWATVRTGIGRNTMEGWAVCYTVNAKNGYGAFTGVKRYLFVLIGSRVVGSLDDAARYNSTQSSIIDRECDEPADPTVQQAAGAPNVGL